MALTTVLALAAGFGWGIQEPSMDTQIVAPILTQSAAVYPIVEQSSDEKVTVQFRDAKASEVLSWLEKHGVSFVVAGGEIPDKTRLTLNLEDQPIESALNAIARALGGHWERDGGVRVFKRGSTTFFAPDGAFGKPGEFRVFRDGQSMPTMPKMPAMPLMKDMPTMPPMPAAPLMPKGQKMSKEDAEKAFGKDYQKKMEDWSKSFEKQFGPEYQKKMELWSKDFEKQNGPEYQKKMEDWAKGFQKQFGPEFQKQMELRAKEWEKMSEDGKSDGNRFFFRFDGDGSKLEPKQIEELKARAKALQGKSFNFEFGKEGAFKLDRKQIEELKAQAKSQADMGQKLRIFSSDKKPFELFVETAGARSKSFGLSNSLDVEAFMKSLTTNQKDMQRKRGYIRYSDLTPEQKKLMGSRPDGRFEFSFKINGDEISVRND